MAAGVRVDLEPRTAGVVMRVTDLPLGAAIAAGIDCFAQAYATDEPSRMMQAFLARPRPK